MTYVHKAVELNRGGTTYVKGVGFDAGTTVTIDSAKITGKWRNPVLQIVKPLSPSNQTTAYNNGDSFTSSGYTITNTTGSFNSAVKAGDIIVISSVEYKIYSMPAANQAVVTRDPPASGTLAVYKGITTYMVNLKKVTETVTVDGYLVNDYTNHPSLGTKKYVEEKMVDLFTIIGDSGNTSGLFSMVWREDDMLTGRYVRQVLCTDFTWDDTAKTESPIYTTSGMEHIDKIRVTLTLLRGVPK